MAKVTYSSLVLCFYILRNGASQRVFAPHYLFVLVFFVGTEKGSVWLGKTECRI